MKKNYSILALICLCVTLACKQKNLGTTPKVENKNNVVNATNAIDTFVVESLVFNEFDAFDKANDSLKKLYSGVSKTSINKLNVGAKIRIERYNEGALPTMYEKEYKEEADTSYIKLVKKINVSINAAGSGSHTYFIYKALKTGNTQVVHKCIQNIPAYIKNVEPSIPRHKVDTDVYKLEIK